MFIPVSAVQYMFLSVSTVLCGASVPQCHSISGALPRILSTRQEGEISDNQLLSTVTNIHLSTSLRFRPLLITSLTLSSLLKSNLMYALPTIVIDHDVHGIFQPHAGMKEVHLLIECLLLIGIQKRSQILNAFLKNTIYFNPL